MGGGSSLGGACGSVAPEFTCGARQACETQLVSTLTCGDCLGIGLQMSSYTGVHGVATRAMF